jgi:hypothetical protein
MEETIVKEEELSVSVFVTCYIIGLALGLLMMYSHAVGLYFVAGAILIIWLCCILFVVAYFVSPEKMTKLVEDAVNVVKAFIKERRNA